MRFIGMPKSIRGKLILAFLAAIGPLLFVQISSEIDDLIQTRELCVNHQRTTAKEVALALSADLANMRQEQHERAQAMAGTETVEAHSGLVSAGSSRSGLRPGSAGDTIVSDVKVGQGNTATIEFCTPVRLSDGRDYRLVTHVETTELIDDLPAESSCWWRLRPRNGGAAIWGRGHVVAASNQKFPDWLAREQVSFPQSPSGGQCISATVGVPGTIWNVQIADTGWSELVPARRRWLWLWGFLAAAVAGVLTIFALGDQLTHPIRRLANAARAIAVGDYGRRIKVQTGDELETLGESFNMAGQSLIAHERALRMQTEMLAGMVEAARVASSSIDMQECGKAIAKVLRTHFGANEAAVFHRDSDDGGVKIIGKSRRGQRADWRRIASHSANSGGYLVISERNVGAIPGEKDAFLVGVPLTMGAETLGAIVARFEGNLQKNDLQIGSAKADVLTAFGVHAAEAIRNAEVHSQTERYSEVLEDWVEHLSGVMQVTDAISPSLDLEGTLAALARATADVLKVDECAIYLPDKQNNLAVRACCHLGPEITSKISLEPGQVATGKAFAEKKYVTYVDMTRSRDSLTRRQAELLGMCGVLSTPLMVEEQAIGVITAYTRNAREFTPTEIRLLTSIGLHAAVIVRNASLYTREASIAETLQMGLVPDVPDECRGLSFAGRYIPALDEARVGGDFYDVAELPNGKVGVVIGDVSGKGLSAAIHLATCKYMMKSLMYTYPDDPGTVLSKLNDAFNHYFDLSFFVTVLYVVVDPSNGDISYANAGHPPALLTTQDGKMQTCLVATGTPVGSGHSCIHRTCQVKAGRPDLMLMYTDGVIDTLSKDALLGIERIQRIIFDAGSCSAIELIDLVCRKLNQEAGSSVKDDTALLAMSFSNAVSFPGDISGGADEREHNLEARTA